MLTIPEKLLFVLAFSLTLVLALRAIRRLVQIIDRGQGAPNWQVVPARLWRVSLKVLSFEPVFRARKLTSLFHGLVAWGFIYYLLVNLGDVLQGLLPGFRFLGQGWIGDLYRLGADLLSVAVLVGMLALMLRRFVLKPSSLHIRSQTKVHPKAEQGIERDSLIVGVFILLHVGARFFAESFHLAAHGRDAWQPFASSLSTLWSGWSGTALEVGQHLGWWLAIGLIFAFVPYFPQSKHLHLFGAPLNFLLKPDRRSMGALDALDFEDESIEQFGAERLEHLSWTALLDAYACIMCNRCQDACPAYATGKVLSPAALEINKRYFLNVEGQRLAQGEMSQEPLTDFAISHEAIWACTACGACIDICPVANEPMRDILEIRRHLVLMENAFPQELQTAFRGMERSANPWSIPAAERMQWAQDMHVPTVRENPDFELLWWVGCAPATDARAQKTAQAFARVLNTAGVNYAVLGSEERCTGDSARRAGNEYLFFELASANVALLKEVAPARIVTTCPHCMHTLANEYPDFDGHFEVIHHTELLQELVETGALPLEGEEQGSVTFHDPCYLGRQNGVFEAPRQLLEQPGLSLVEMQQSGRYSFCCGAGGAQMWKEEEQGSKRVSEARVQEAEATGARTLAVGCPFCMIMLSDAADASDDALEVRDVVELVAERVQKPQR